MQENKGQIKLIYKRSNWGKLSMIKVCIGVGLVLGLVLLLCTVACSSKEGAEEPVDSVETSTSLSVSTEAAETTEVVTEEPITSLEETDAPIRREEDPNNSVSPYSMMSTDWGTEVYAQGFKYYEIPASYKMAGGMFPEVAQIYLWCICREAGVDYYMALALIERESGYKYDATGDSGRSKGLMQKSIF